MSDLFSAVAPETLPHEPPASRCRRSCCWTPLGHSTAATSCTCHEGDPMGDRVPLPILRKLTARDGHECALTGTGTERLVPQHRQGGMGGRANKHRLSNLVWIDSIANGLITADARLQQVAKAWGIAISLHAATEEIPVFFPHRHAWFRLVGDTRIPITALEALDRMHAFYGDEYFIWKAAADRSVHEVAIAARGVR